MEDLEETHIEWVSPDGKMKQCYNVQTLIKIACKGGKNELLQPPHFRSPMSRSLKEQIEEKFPGIISKLKKVRTQTDRDFLMKMISMRKRWKIIFKDTVMQLKV